MYYGAVRNRRFNLPVTIFVLLLALVGLAGCGGPDPGSSATPTPGQLTPTAEMSPTPPTEATKVQEVQQAETQVSDDPIERAVNSHLASQMSFPYRDVRVQVISQDDAFATVEVRLFMRKSEIEDWEEYSAIYKLKFVSERWSIDEAEPLVSVLAPQMTATAETAMQQRAWLVDLHMLSTTEGWAIGLALPESGASTGGTVVLKYADGGWEQVEFLRHSYLNSIYMVSEDEGWAVGNKLMVDDKGNEYGPGPGLILHYTGGAWQEETYSQANTAGDDLKSVYMLSAQEGWAVGNLAGSANGGRSVLHYKDGTWEQVEVAAPPEGYKNPLVMQSVTMASPELGWAVGERQMLQYKDGEWAQVLYNVEGYNDRYVSPAQGLDMLRVSALTPDEGWAVGRGALLHYTGGKWQAEVNSLHDVNDAAIELQWLQDIQMLAPDDVWAVGYENPKKTGNSADEKSVIVHYTGGEWQKVEHPTITGRLTAVHMLTAQEGWAVGGDGSDGVILHYKDGAWTRYER